MYTVNSMAESEEIHQVHFNEILLNSLSILAEIDTFFS